MAPDPIRREIDALRAHIDECLQRIDRLERRLEHGAASHAATQGDVEPSPGGLGSVTAGSGAPSDPFEYVYTPRRIRTQPSPPERTPGFTIRDLPLPHPLAPDAGDGSRSGDAPRIVFRGLDELLGGLDVRAPGDGF